MTSTPQESGLEGEGTQPSIFYPQTQISSSVQQSVGAVQPSIGLGLKTDSVDVDKIHVIEQQSNTDTEKDLVDTSSSGVSKISLMKLPAGLGVTKNLALIRVVDSHGEVREDVRALREASMASS